MPRYFNSPLRTNRQIFVSSSFFNVPPGVSLVYVTLAGGGGGGAGGTEFGGGGGGGAGFTFVNAPIYVNPTESIWIQVGSGGLGGGRDQNGQPGANSIFGIYLIASGGDRGLTFWHGTRTGGRGGSYGFITGGLGGHSSVFGNIPATSGSNGMYILTQSISSAGTLFTMAGGGGGGGSSYELADTSPATSSVGGYSGDQFLSPFLPGFGPNSTGGGGGASAIGSGWGSARTGGLAGGGAGGRSLMGTGLPTSGTRGSAGLCSISWD